MDPMEYEDWLSGVSGSAPSMVEAGEELFGQLGCAVCHGADSGARGPQLDDLFGSQVSLSSGESLVADDEYIRESILNPNEKIVAGYAPLMPTYRGQLDEEALLKLVAYIQSLSPGEKESQAERISEK
jgi:cytochrome c oxidase subunit 2